MRLEKRGDTITLFVSMKGEPLHQAGASIKLHFAEPFYAGLGVCSHRDGALEKATFSHVELKPLAAPQNPAPTALYSTLKTIAIDNDYRRALRGADGQGTDGGAELVARREDADFRSRRTPVDGAGDGRRGKRDRYWRR